MGEVQEPLFDADRSRNEHIKVCAEIRDSAEVIRSSLKECAGHVALLKDGPKTTTDILFRCQATNLASDHLKLLAEQATELGTLYEKVQKETAKMLKLENRRDELAKEMAANGEELPQTGEGDESHDEEEDPEDESGESDGLDVDAEALRVTSGKPVIEENQL